MAALRKQKWADLYESETRMGEKSPNYHSTLTASSSLPCLCHDLHGSKEFLSGALTMFLVFFS